VRRAQKIDNKVRDCIRGNSEIANSGAELDALASLDKQREASGQDGRGRKAKTVREARDKIVSPTQKAPAVRVTSGAPLRGRRILKYFKIGGDEWTA
jgi:hypothetical protein